MAYEQGRWQSLLVAAPAKVEYGLLGRLCTIRRCTTHTRVAEEHTNRQHIALQGLGAERSSSILEIASNR